MRRLILVVGAVGVMIVAGWIAADPEGRFGMSCGGLTTYKRLPLPFADLQVRSDGAMRVIAKSHRVWPEQLAWLAGSEPEVLIMAAGWQGDVRGPGQLDPLRRTRILTLSTGKALRLFNSLRDQGVRVAIHVPSTC